MGGGEMSAATCALCGADAEAYGTTSEGEQICHACCGRLDRQKLFRGEPITLYWDGTEVTNWPGTVRFVPTRTKKGSHNIAKTRTDVWFRAEGRNWHGVQLGEFSQILRITEVA